MYDKYYTNSEDNIILFTQQSTSINMFIITNTTDNTELV